MMMMEMMMMALDLSIVTIFTIHFKSIYIQRSAGPGLMIEGAIAALYGLYVTAPVFFALSDTSRLGDTAPEDALPDLFGASCPLGIEVVRKDLEPSPATAPRSATPPPDPKKQRDFIWEKVFWEKAFSRLGSETAALTRTHPYPISQC